MRSPDLCTHRCVYISQIRKRVSVDEEKTIKNSNIAREWRGRGLERILSGLGGGLIGGFKALCVGGNILYI
jgi:hypothetical protein